MRLGVWALAALLLGALLAHFLLQDRGYVLIDFRGYLVEMSLPGLVLLLIAGYLTVRALVHVWRAPRRLGEALAGRRVRSAGDRLTRGVMHLTEGDWARGERLLTRSLRASDAPLVNYLMAARAAQQLGSRERRNEWLKLAFEELPEAETTILLTQAELQLEASETEGALASLQRIIDRQPGNPVAVGLLAEAYHRVGDTRRLRALVPQLAAADLPAATRVARILEGLEGSADEAFDLEGLERVWSQLTSELRRDPALIVWRARQLNRLGAGDQAEPELRAALKRDWDERLVTIYGELATSAPRKQLKQAEAWLAEHPDDAALLIAAARLCLANDLWGKARSYLESSLALRRDASAYSLYGHLLSQLGEDEAAADAFRDGLSLVSGAPPELPALAAPPKLVADKR